MNFMTHEAREADVIEALEKIEKLDCVEHIGTFIRIEER